MTEQEYTDEELAVLAGKGDDDAANLLIDRYKPLARSRSSAYFLKGGDKDDLIQEGMIGVFKAVRDFDPDQGASFASFAELCVRRQIISAVKGSNRQKHMALNESMSLESPLDRDDENGSTLEETIPDGPAGDPESLMIMHEKMDLIEKGCSDILSRMENDVWQMYLEGRTYSEIAAGLDMTSKAVDNAIHRAKKKLADLIND